jgi:SAM-dependent methyltransferase
MTLLIHKPFVAGSATATPFSDNAFDTIWTIWVLEHVPNPEQALREIRRAAKDGGLLFLAPAWDVPSWAAQGCDYHPYSDFGTGGESQPTGAAAFSGMGQNDCLARPLVHLEA